MSGWIGVDFDGTLAHYEGFAGAGVLGKPVPAMLERVKAWLADGREVRIFTARIWPCTQLLHPDTAMAVPEGEAGRQAFEAACAIAAWCREHVGQVLPITCVKDYGMIELYDDRCIQVEPNTGRLMGSPRPLR